MLICIISKILCWNCLTVFECLVWWSHYCPGAAAAVLRASNDDGLQPPFVCDRLNWISTAWRRQTTPQEGRANRSYLSFLEWQGKNGGHIKTNAFCIQDYINTIRSRWSQCTCLKLMKKITKILIIKTGHSSTNFIRQNISNQCNWSAYGNVSASTNHIAEFTQPATKWPHILVIKYWVWL